MNVRMWLHAATQRNIATLRGDGVTVMAPDEGEMACGEYGPGRLPEPEAIKQAIDEALAHAPARSEEHTSELQSLMRISYAVFCLKKKKKHNIISQYTHKYTSNKQSHTKSTS